MKKTVYTFLLVVYAQLAHAQSSATTSRDDDTILLDLAESPEASWKRLAHILVARGYSIEHSDKDLLTLSTYALGSDAFPVRVTGTVVNNTLLLRIYEQNAVTHVPMPIAVVRRRGGGNSEWRELEAIAQEFGGTKRYTVSATTLANKL
ncbi:hypothetical protein MUN82_09500 [Hymenobacter aerilatus]|uniref:Uncharacterized protein n=1 Tax=Hymenobacter aerilatus TaxID=2932251 RepID=A0A8T9SZ07_9BACT|nr:hypothetical protein [Hymenobacter aerilatus]UOR07318.1 hypothetical protein MUN82_09500 [Hymenobacter aerilatus]